MRHSLLSLLFSALVLCAAAPRALAVNFQCAQKTIDADESEGKVALELLRDGDLSLWAEASFSIQEKVGSQWKYVADLKALFEPGSDRATAMMNIDDGVYSGDRVRLATCFGRLEPNSGSSSVGNIVVNIREDDPFPTITRPPLIIHESDANPITVPFTLSGPLGREMTLHPWTGSNDIITVIGRVPANVTSGWFTIHVINDQVPEPDKTSTILMEIDGVVRHTFPVTIIDDDGAPFPVSFHQSSYELAEGAANNVVVTRSGNTAVAVNGTLHIDTTTPGVWPADVPVSFAPGESEKMIPLPFDDHAFGGHRIATLQFIAPNRFVAAKAPVSMVDDDPMPVLSISGDSVNEGNSSETTKAEVMLTLSAPLAVDLRFNIFTSHGTATAADYTHLDTDFFIAPGGLSKKVTIDVRGDDAVEPDETLRVEIRHCCDSLALIEPHSATITIRNDDDGSSQGPPQYKFARPRSGWKESDTWLTATVLRSGTTNRATSVRATLIVDGRPFAPQDIRFRAGETSKVVRFYIDDLVYSGNTFRDALLELFDGTRRLDMERGAIVDDETTPEITFTNIEVTEGQTDRDTAFVLKITPASAKPIEARMSLSEYGYGASIASDIRGLRNRQRFVIPAGRSEYVLDFTVIGDSAKEDAEAIEMWLEVDKSLAIVRGAARCTIHDDDTIGATLVMPASLARGATGTITVTLLDAAPFDEQYTISTTTPGLVSVPATMTMRGGHKSATFEVTGLGSGDANVSVTLPKRLKNTALSEPLLVYTLTTPILPERVRIPVGTSVLVNVGLSAAANGEFDVAASTADATIAGVRPSAALAPNGGTIAVHGAAVGTTTLAITLPAELGSTTAIVPVEVFVPVPGKTRAARH